MNERDFIKHIVASDKPIQLLRCKQCELVDSIFINYLNCGNINGCFPKLFDAQITPNEIVAFYNKIISIPIEELFIVYASSEELLKTNSRSRLASLQYLPLDYQEYCSRRESLEELQKVYKGVD